jgi:transcription elongation factor Elf1
MEMLLEATVACPHCGETFQTVVDSSQNSYSTVEDCPVCCRPIELEIECAPGEIFSVSASV